MTMSTSDLTHSQTRLPDNWWLRLFHNRAASAGGIFVLLALFLALAGPPLYQYALPSDQPRTRDGVYQDYDAINAAPSPQHWLGADYLGRDMFTRLFVAVRVSLLVALVVETLNVVLGGVLGLLAGYFGGWIDVLISRAA